MGHPTNIILRTASEYRRIVWYEWTGIAALAAITLIWIPRWLSQSPDVSSVAGVLCFLSIIVGIQTFATYNYRLVLDETGIRRRRFGMWDHWPWTDFENGLVEQDALGQFVNHARRRGTRTLGFPHAAEPVALAIKRQCLVKWNPPPIQMPVRFRIRVNRRRTGEVTAGGLTLRDRRTGEKHTHPWSQLQRAVIFKDFDREHIASRVHLAFPTGHWMIDFLSYTALPGKYLLPAMIERCAPADRIVTVPLHDPPRTSQARRLALADIRSQLWRDRRESRAMFKWGIVWLVLVLFPLWIWSQWPKDHVEWLATIVSFMLVFGGLWAVLALQYILLSRFVRKRLCTQRDRLLNDSPPAEAGGPRGSRATIRLIH